MGTRHGLCALGAIVLVALAVGGCGGRGEAPSAVSLDAGLPAPAVAVSTAPAPGAATTDGGVSAPETAAAQGLEAAVSPGELSESLEKPSAATAGPPAPRASPSPAKRPGKAASAGNTSVKPATTAGGTTGAASEGQGAPSAKAPDATSQSACKAGCGPSGCAPTGKGLPGWGALKEGTGGMLSR